MSSLVKTYPPLQEGSAIIGRECPICFKPFEVGDITTIAKLTYFDVVVHVFHYNCEEPK